MLLDLPPLLEVPASPAIVRAANLDSIRPWREALEENWRLPYWKERQKKFKEYQEAMFKGLVPLVPAIATLKVAPLTVTYNTAVGSNSAATNYTFNATALSAAANPLRWVVTGVHGSLVS